MRCILKLLLPVGSLAWLASCGVGNAPLFDGGKELVNAAGRSLAETSALVRDGAQVNEPSKSHFGWTPLISAVYNHKEDVIDFLLLNGADPNLGDEDDRNALIWTIQSWAENTNLVIKLLQHGADPSLRTKLGSNAFDAARSQPNGEVLAELMRTFHRSPPRQSPGRPGETNRSAGLHHSVLSCSAMQSTGNAVEVRSILCENAAAHERSNGNAKSALVNAMGCFACRATTSRRDPRP